MRRLVLLASVLVFALTAPVEAGENRYLGRIISTGTSVNNSTTTGTPFAIPLNSKLTLYCDAAGRLLTDSQSVATSGATTGLPVAALTYFPTSVGSIQIRVSGVTSALIAWISNTGTANCDVWQRSGTE